MKKIIFSLMTIAAVAAMVISSTTAFFSDTETSTGNTFTAGGIDLKVDSESHYNGLVCVDGKWSDPDYVDCNVNQVSNFSFETPQVEDASGWDIYPPSETDWFVEWQPTVPATYGGYTRPTDPQLEYHHYGGSAIKWHSHEGNQYVELDSDWNGHVGNLNNEPASARISQVIPTVPGKTYTLSFWFSPRPGTPLADNKLEVVWDGTVLATGNTISASGSGLSDTSWTEYTFSVVATAYNTTLEFADVGNANSLGTFLDDINIYAVECVEIPSAVGGDCYGTWEETDLKEGVHKFFYFEDIKPGDWGEDTISLHVYDNDAWGRLVINNLIDADNGCVEPEVAVDADCLTTGDTGADGEMRENLDFWVWLDQGIIPGFQNGDPTLNGEIVDAEEGDNIWQETSEPLLISPGSIGENGETWNLWEGLAPTYSTFCSQYAEDGNDEYAICHGIASDGRMVASTTYYFGVAWELPAGTGNDVQTDMFGGDMILEVEQHRNNTHPFAEPE